ncbi:MAG: nickel/cobalt transporter [Thermoproteota archaeon]|nr:nickel/cobalt transporter [Thermoproteota archaeon]
MSSGMIVGVTFLSSIIVVVAYISVTLYVQLPQLYLNYAAGIALGILAYIFWRDKGEDLIETQHGHLHTHPEKLEDKHIHWQKDLGHHARLHLHQKRVKPTLSALIAFALVLGFAHEEEFVILALAAGGAEPLLLMVSYAVSVAISLVGTIILVIKVYAYVERRLIAYTRYLPRISALILAAMAFGFVFGLI